jgi:predicted O-methyltransferase YrrM
MTGLLHYLKPARVFEFGTNRGRTTRLIAERTPQETQIFTLDLPPEVLRQAASFRRMPIDRPGEAFQGLPVAAKITQLLGDSRTFDYRPYYGTMDFIFIDANHTYEGVASDTAHAFRMLRPGGTIIWDDYHPAWPGVMRCVEELAASELEIAHVAGTRFAHFRGEIGDTIPISQSDSAVSEKN